MAKCRPPEFSEIIEPTGNDAARCQIKIKALTKELSGAWSARIDNSPEESTNVSVAQAVQSGEIKIEGVNGSDALTAGVPGNVSCSIYGGVPEPSISMAIQGLDASKQVDNGQKSGVNDKGVSSVVQKIQVNATADDYGRQITCQAGIFNKDDSLMFEMFNAPSVSLNVNFKPQPAAKQDISGKLNSSVTINFEFKANPKPDSIEWLITKPSKENEETTTPTTTEKPNEQSRGDDTAGATISLKPGQSDDKKYNVSQLEDKGGMMYKTSLVINELRKPEDEYQYELKVKNSVGEQSYPFEIKIDENGGAGGSNAGGDGGKNKSSGKAGLIIGIIILSLIAVLVIVAVGVIIKRKRGSSPTVPLSSMGPSR